MKKDERIAQAQIERFDRSQAYSLSDVYGRYSHAKAQAWKNCENLYNKLGGYGAMKIISHNSNFFSVGFRFVDAETGVLKFAYITKGHDRFCEC